MFADYLLWCRAVAESAHREPTDLDLQVARMQQVLHEHLDADASTLVGRWLASATRAVPSVPLAAGSQHVDGSETPTLLAYQYTQALLRGDRVLASALVLDAAGGGMSVADIYLQVFQESQYTVGSLWERGWVDVGQEHYCTGSTVDVMSQTFSLFDDAAAAPVGHAVVVACVPDERHELGARMVSDCFRMAGWDSYCTGADTPVASMVSALLVRGADVLALSVTTEERRGHVQVAIQAVRNHPELGHVRILAGGAVMQRNRDLWKVLGADATGFDAREAVTAATAMMLGPRVKRDSTGRA
jgi:methanogenic corrinoid protein MtbC1